MHAIDLDQLFGLLSVVVNFFSSGIYTYATFKGETKPHFFTTITWVIPTAIVFLAQALNGAGPGSWSTACTFLFCLCTCIMSFKYRGKYIIKSDYIFLALSMLAVLLWIITKNALLSVIFCTAIDVIGFIPTIRKTWHDPMSENLMSYALTVLKHIFSLLALNVFNTTTAFFPIVMILLNGSFCFYLQYRRSKMNPVVEAGG